MSTKITRISQIAKERPKEKFTAVYHLINEELLLECYNELDKDKATGIDGVTKEMYFMNLEANLKGIVNRLKTMSYKPSPARKIEIPKGNGKVRTIAIANFEDKIVQLAIKKIVEAIYVSKFPKNMFGFIENRSCHDCLKYLNRCIEKEKTNYILDADIKGYFDNIDHELIMKGLEMHIGDKRLLRLIKRFLIVGIMEDGKYIASDKGTPQGSILSPILANIVMYYGIIQHVERIKAKAKGYIEIINYADDIVLCFQYKEEAIRTYKMLKQRLEKLGLEFAKDKTRLIEFGRFAEENRKRNGKGKPETFDFLGFTHYCSKSSDGKRFRVKRKTSRKKLKQKIKSMKIWLKENKKEKLVNIIATLKRKLIGHYNYYGITDNSKMLEVYKQEVQKMLFKWLNRRSQRRSYTSKGFNEMLKIFKLPTPKIRVNIYT